MCIYIHSQTTRGASLCVGYTSSSSVAPLAQVKPKPHSSCYRRRAAPIQTSLAFQVLPPTRGTMARKFAAMSVVFACACCPFCSATLQGSLKRRIERALADASGTDDTQNEVASSSRDAPRGSLRTRVERAMDVGGQAASANDLPLVRSLLAKWAKGQISSALVQEFALCAAQQGACGMERLSRAGSSGSQPQNLQRAILTFVGNPLGAPDFTWVPVQTPKGTSLHPVFLPHQFFSRLYQVRRFLWEESIRGPVGAAHDFWNAIQGSSIVRDHPGLYPERLHKTLPLGLHGDNGAFSKQDRLFVLSWNSILASLGGSGFARRFLFTILKKDSMTTATLDVLWRVFAWSMNALLTGITPERDWNQQPIEGGGEYIAGGWRGALVQLRGDWEFYANTLGPETWASAANMRWLCSASNTVAHLLWHNFGPDAGQELLK